MRLVPATVVHWLYLTSTSVLLYIMAVQYRAGKYLDEIHETSIGTDNVFCEINVKEVQESSRLLVNDICKTFGAESLTDLNPAMMNKNTVVKAQMAEWLFSAIYLLDQCSLPLMSNARVQLENLNGEKIEDQKSIIKLQSDLISQKNEELGLVSKTVEAELKTYSSALQQSCSTALSPKNIVAAVQKVAREDDRSKEILVFGVAEEKGECATAKVAKILDHLEEKPKFQQCRRIGQQRENTVRPIKFSVRSTDIVYQILSKAKRLREVEIEGYKTVYLSPNRTPEERVTRQKLVAELKQKRIHGDPNSRYFIRKGEIVQAALEESFHSTD